MRLNRSTRCIFCCFLCISAPGKPLQKWWLTPFQQNLLWGRVLTLPQKPIPYLIPIRIFQGYTAHAFSLIHHYKQEWEVWDQHRFRDGLPGTLVPWWQYEKIAELVSGICCKCAANSTQYSTECRVNTVVLSKWLGPMSCLNNDCKMFRAQVLLDRMSEIVVVEAFALTTNVVDSDVQLNKL